jgi:hypothetical protein
MFQKLYRVLVPERAREYLYKHRHRIPTAALIAGLVWDSITLGRPDRLFDNLVLLFYIIIAGIGILIIANQRERNMEKASLPLLILIQFSFGNLVSALFVLYGKSAPFIGGLPFFLLLIALFIGNELFRNRYGLIRFNVGIYYLLLLLYFALVVPVLLRQIGVGVFLLSGLVSVIAIYLYILFMRTVAPRLVQTDKSSFVKIVGSTLVAFNIFYFLNVIPPVPLALREAGIYHHVVRSDSSEYTVQYEKGKWYEFWKRSDSVFNAQRDDSAHCFSAVFAPERLNTSIYHHWEYFNRESGRWKSAARISFGIVGGRDEGFRGFSEKTGLTPGKWRCSVETGRGALIGRDTFTVVHEDKELELVTAIR